LGCAVHPAFAAIIVDPNSTIWRLHGVSGALADKPGKYPQYVPIAFQRLTADNALMPVDPEPIEDTEEFKIRRLLSMRLMVREWAIELIADHGDERDAAFLLPYFQGTDPKLRRAAADAFVQIGGPRELAAMNQWIDAQNPGNPWLRGNQDAARRARTATARGPGAAHVLTARACGLRLTFLLPLVPV
jgi:hypothetical protein